MLAADQGLGTAVWVLLLFTGVHAIEGYVLTPLLATPATVVLTTAIQMLYVEDVLGDRP